MKRGLTLAGGIIGTIVNAGVIAFVGITLVPAMFVVGTVAGSATGSTSADAAVGALAGLTGMFLVLLIIASLAFAIVALILNAVAIGAWHGDAEKYRRRRGVIIAAIVFNVFVIIYGLVTFGVLYGSLIAAALVAVSVFYIVDLCLEKNRIAKAQAAQVVQAPTQE